MTDVVNFRDPARFVGNVRLEWATGRVETKAVSRIFPGFRSSHLLLIMHAVTPSNGRTPIAGEELKNLPVTTNSSYCAIGAVGVQVDPQTFFRH